MPPAAPEPTPRERIARIQSLALRALAYWKTATFIVVIGCAIAVVVATRVKLIYRSECIVLFKPAIKTSERPEDESPSERAAKLAPKLREVLTTRSRLAHIITEYSLYPKVVESKGMLEAVDQMRDHVGFRGRDSETFVISYENEEPSVAQKVTQRLADTMIDEFTKSSVSAAKQQADFLTAQEGRSERELETANKALATFLTLHPEFAVEAKGGLAFPLTPQTAPMARVAPLPRDPAAMGDPQLAVLFRQKARLETELLHGADSAPPPAAGVPANAEQLARLAAARDETAKVAAAAQADVAEKRTKLTDEHPDVIAANSAAEVAARQLHQAEAQLAAAQAATSGSTATPDESRNVAGTNPELQRRLDAITARIAERRAILHAQQRTTPPEGAPAVDGGGALSAAARASNELVELETEWQRLLRILHDVKGEHDDLKQRLERAKLATSAAEASGGDQMQILDTAYKPLRPSQGGRTKTALLGGFMAVVFAVGYALSRVLFNDTIVDRADIEALKLIPVLGVVPKLRAGGPPPPAKGAGGAA